MALLTEEQINDILDITNVCESSIVVSKLIEWNEKQTTQQVAIDWSDAPKHATKAMLKMHWVTESEGSELWFPSGNSVIFDRPVSVITPHPHAAIMAKYADVAQRRTDPWVEFEYKHKANKNWISFISYPNFNIDYNYRYIGDNK